MSLTSFHFQQCIASLFTAARASFRDSVNKNFAELEKQLETTQQQLKEKEHKERGRQGSSSSLDRGSKGAAAAQSMIRKTGNSVRARLLKMSLHSESQC